MTKAQKRLLKSLRHWGELGPEAEWDVGCTGAAFEAVVRAAIARGWAEDRTEGACSFLAITEAGKQALDARQ